MNILLRKAKCWETNRYKVLFKDYISVEINEDYIMLNPLDIKVKLGKIGLDKFINKKLNHIVWYYYRSISYKLLERHFNKINSYKDLILSIYKKEGNDIWKKIY